MSILTNSLFVVLFSMGLLYIAYKVYGGFLARRVFGFDNKRTTPSEEFNDGLDFVPTRPAVLFGHHFASIAGLAPIVGPAIAVYWGWLPALIWVLGGAILIGAVHDLAALFTSIRHKARSIGGLTEDIIGPRAKLLFLCIIFFLLALAMGVFALIMAKLFVNLSPEAVVPTFTLIAIAMVIGTLVYKFKVRLLPVTLFGVGFMFIMMFVGMYNPVEIHNRFVTDPEIHAAVAQLEAETNLRTVPEQVAYFTEHNHPEIADDLSTASQRAQKAWIWVLLAYALAASILPVWLLLQPRDYINCFQLYAGLGLMFLGFVVWHPSIEAPLFRSVPGDGTAQNVLPFLFITIACGAVSGFHNLVSSGTTARQIRKESDAQVIGYGGMLTEGLLAVFVIAACVGGFTLAEYNDNYASFGGITNNALGAFLSGAGHVVSEPFDRLLGNWFSKEAIHTFCKTFMAVMVVSFAMTTLDSGTRLLRYNVEELGKSFGVRFTQNRFVSSAIAVLAIGYFAVMKIHGQAAGLALWQLFGTTNQLLACLGLLVASVFLYRLGKPVAYTLLPMLVMLVIVAWAISLNLIKYYHAWHDSGDLGSLSLLVVGSVLAILAVWMLVEAALAFVRIRELFARKDAEALPD